MFTRKTSQMMYLWCGSLEENQNTNKLCKCKLFYQHCIIISVRQIYTEVILCNANGVSFIFYQDKIFTIIFFSSRSSNCPGSLPYQHRLLQFQEDSWNWRYLGPKGPKITPRGRCLLNPQSSRDLGRDISGACPNLSGQFKSFSILWVFLGRRIYNELPYGQSWIRHCFLCGKWNQPPKWKQLFRVVVCQRLLEASNSTEWGSKCQ